VNAQIARSLFENHSFSLIRFEHPPEPLQFLRKAGREKRGNLFLDWFLISLVAFSPVDCGR